MKMAVNFWPRNLKSQINILKNYIWTQQNGFPGTDFTKAGLTLKEEDLMILRPFINYKHLPLKNLLISLSCISSHMLEPKPIINCST